MKYIKYFEKLNKYEEAGIIEIIKNNVEDQDDNSVDIDPECPFLTELWILHQKDYISEVYDSVKYDSVHSEEMKNITLKDFTRVYKKLLKKAPDTILDYLKKEPKWFQEWMDDYEDLDIPYWIKNVNKFNI